jgi:hypothetical protein
MHDEIMPFAVGTAAKANGIGHISSSQAITLAKISQHAKQNYLSQSSLFETKESWDQVGTVEYVGSG